MLLEKIIIHNFKIFSDIKITFNKEKNIFIGENGTGKSTLLLALDLTLSGSYSKVESIGLETLFNNNAIDDFCNSKRKYEDLPKLSIEIFFEDTGIFKLNGIHNSENRVCDGMSLSIVPDDECSKEIHEVISSTDFSTFPFEYYNVLFKTFSGETYNSYDKKYTNKHLLIDTTSINSKYAVENYTKRVYSSVVSSQEQQKINLKYRNKVNVFSKELQSEFSGLKNSEQEIYVNTHGEDVFKKSITIKKHGININSFGKGELMFINTDFSLSNANKEVETILLEEPENHLSHLNMNKLINKINSSYDKQTFIATHNNMISSRLELKNVFLLHDAKVISFNSLSDDTSDFFSKIDNNNILNFILSKKSILVEGSAEFILLDYLYQKEYGANMYSDDISLISCNGKTFKRYLEIAKILSIKTLVITDNDKNYQKNITETYTEYLDEEKIKIKAPTDNDVYTFEVSLYMENKDFIDTNIYTKNMTNGVLTYMLSNKAESAYRILNCLTNNQKINFTLPNYIQEGFEWIRK